MVHVATSSFHGRSFELAQKVSSLRPATSQGLSIVGRTDPLQTGRAEERSWRVQGENIHNVHALHWIARKPDHHDLRHWFATRAVACGVPVPVMADWLGLKDGGTLLLRILPAPRPAGQPAMGKAREDLTPKNG